MARRWLFFALLIACLVLAARVSQQYVFRLDLSAQQINTLSPSAARALAALPAGLRITAFLPDFPVQRAQLEQLLAPYLAHSADVRLDFVDPIKQPEAAREHGVSRHGEIHLASGPRREVVATPTAQAIDLALNRLALRGERWIVTFKGHGESEIDDTPGGLARFVRHIEGLGYRFVALDPRQLDTLPENTAALLIAAPTTPYEAHTEALIEGFIAGGGNILWLADRALPGFVGRDLGIGLLPGVVVDAAAARYQLDSPDNAIVSDLPTELLAQENGGFAVLKQARALVIDERSGWRVSARLQSSARSWNETGDLKGQIARNPENDERSGPMTVVAVLTRDQGTGRQDQVFVGGRHLISNDQLGQGANLSLAVGLLRWLTANQQLADNMPAADLEIRWSPQLAGWLALGLMGIVPALYLAAGLWLRARRRRA